MNLGLVNIVDRSKLTNVKSRIVRAARFATLEVIGELTNPFQKFIAYAVDLLQPR